MEWEQLTLHFREIKETFDNSYKCVSQNTAIQEKTINKHGKIVVDSLNEARILVHDNREITNKTKWSKISNFIGQVTFKIINYQREVQFRYIDSDNIKYRFEHRYE